MQQLVIHIEDSKVDFLKGLLKELNISIENIEPSKQEIISNIKQGLKEVKQFKKGKLKTTSAKDFLNAL